MTSHPGALAAIVLSLSALFAWLASPRSVPHAAKVFAVSIGFLLALMGFGAVFGKVLGDFLRNVNG